VSLKQELLINFSYNSEMYIIVNMYVAKTAYSLTIAKKGFFL
jgi:hypothetical protein